MNSTEKSPYAGVYNLELFRMLENQRRIMDRYDLDFSHEVYEKAQTKSESIRAELRRRGAL